MHRLDEIIQGHHHANIDYRLARSLAGRSCIQHRHRSGSFPTFIHIL